MFSTVCCQVIITDRPANSARKNSSGNEDAEEGLRNADFSTTLTVFGLKPRSAFTRGTRQDLSSTDPSFTMRRKMEHLREEIEQIGLLRQVRRFVVCLCLSGFYQPMSHTKSNA
ncbi:hypothetical protein GOODEAATRI_005187 [Goodea atripinnis]|uniref:Uncharacterized protein n=1 Tax=Goodea atripinnis TaxID=208336 RepID=A0ABV0NHM6_9TELE